MSSKRGRSGLHSQKPIDYSKLHQGMEESDSSDHDSDGINLGTDLDAERDLCGSFDETEELDYKKKTSEMSKNPNRRKVKYNQTLPSRTAMMRKIQRLAGALKTVI